MGQGQLEWGSLNCMTSVQCFSHYILLSTAPGGLARVKSNINHHKTDI